MVAAQETSIYRLMRRVAYLFPETVQIHSGEIMRFPDVVWWGAVPPNVSKIVFLGQNKMIETTLRPYYAAKTQEHPLDFPPPKQFGL